MEATLVMKILGKCQKLHMQASITEYKRQKRDSQAQKIPQKTLTQQSKKINEETNKQTNKQTNIKAKAPDSKHSQGQ